MSLHYLHREAREVRNKMVQMQVSKCAKFHFSRTYYEEWDMKYRELEQKRIVLFQKIDQLEQEHVIRL